MNYKHSHFQIWLKEREIEEDEAKEGRLRMSHPVGLVAHSPRAGAGGAEGGGIFDSTGGTHWSWPSQRCFGGDKLGTVFQMGTLEWVKPALKRTAPFPPTVTLHTSIQAELRAPLAETQKGQNHSFTLVHSPSLHTRRVHGCMYCTAQTHTRKHTPKNRHTHTHTHSQAQDCTLLVAPRGYTALLQPISTSGAGENVAGYCPDAVIISLMLTQMSMGSSDGGLLIPHMNLVPEGGEEAPCVANMRELHEGAYITHNLSPALMGVFSEFSWYLNQRADWGEETRRMMSLSNYWTFLYSPIPPPPPWKDPRQVHADESPSSQTPRHTNIRIASA